MIDEGLREAREHYASLLEARPTPHVLDDATVTRVKRVNAEASSSATSTSSSRRGWRGERLTDAQRREVACLQSATRELRVVLTQFLSLTDEIASGTIERQLVSVVAAGSRGR